MISAATFFGGARETTLSVDLSLVNGSDRVQTVDPQFAGLRVDLPDATTLRLGGPQFVVLNVGSFSVEVRDASTGTVVTLAAGKAADLSLVGQADAAGSWSAHVLDIA